MSNIRINSISLKNYRSFGNEEQEFIFPAGDYNKPVVIVGYNNSGKTNLMNAILYGVGEKFVSVNTFEKNDLHNLNYANHIEIKTNLSASDYLTDYGPKSIKGVHKVLTKVIDSELHSSVSPSFFGANKYYNIFYINFHKIKEEISTQKTSWGNLKSFLAKHIKQIVDNDEGMKEKKGKFLSDTEASKNEVLEGSSLSNFIEKIKKNYSKNLRDNNYEINFCLPDYEEIFLNMVFKIGLNRDNTNLVPIEHFGDGYISMFVMAVIQAIAESNIEDKCLFLFEEPESFLHDNHQEYFYKRVLCSLAEKGHQVIYTTHSDKMVDMFDTKGLIRIEFDETSKQTIKRYNEATENFNKQLTYEDNNGLVAIADYNSYIKNIEPNLNRILFSKKVILVEGPNDVMAYKYAIKKKIISLGKDTKFAETYLNFNNIAIIPHHGKATALVLIALCKHLGVDYFVINDLDFEDDFVAELFKYASEGDFKQSALYSNETDSNKKGMLTTNWKLTNSAGNGKIHFNIKKLETVLGYALNDKNSVKLWDLLQGKDTFEETFFPESLKNFLEFDSIPAEEVPARGAVIEEPATPKINDEESAILG
ncbi:AAA family ATPase [Candidatus Woesearchaeota archaeon]|nr:AAA family ATPase [Candidatus Woesearchaeota archaeon]